MQINHQIKSQFHSNNLVIFGDFLSLKDCVLTEQKNNMAGVNFVISSKLYVPVVTLSTNHISNF